MLMLHPRTAKNEGYWRSTKGPRKMATYEVTCEFLAQRTVWVEARHGVEAEFLARQKIAEQENLEIGEVAAASSKRETVTHPYQFDLWREEN
jgi:hypothetical protein